MTKIRKRTWNLSCSLATKTSANCSWTLIHTEHPKLSILEINSAKRFKSLSLTAVNSTSSHTSMPNLCTLKNIFKNANNSTLQGYNSAKVQHRESGQLQRANSNPHGPKKLHRLLQKKITASRNSIRRSHSYNQMYCSGYSNSYKDTKITNHKCTCYNRLAVIRRAVCGPALGWMTISQV